MSETPKDPSDKLTCSFCSKGNDEVAMLIAGVTGFICSECVSLCVCVIADAASRKARTYFLRPEEVPPERIDEIMRAALHQPEFRP